MALIFCPDCGKQVSQYAKMCPNCGYPIEEKLAEVENEEAAVTYRKSEIKQSAIPENVRNNTSIDDSKAHKVLLIAAIIIVAVLYIRTINIYNYIEAIVEILIGAAVLAALIYMYKKCFNERTLKKSLLVLVSVLAVGLLLVANMVYYSKYDYAISHIPDNKEVYVLVKMDVDFYSHKNAGDKIVNPDVYMEINDVYVNGGDVVRITLDESKITKMGCGYRMGAENYGSWNDMYKMISTSMIGDTEMKNQIKINADVQGEITYSLKRKVTFWEVILF